MSQTFTITPKKRLFRSHRTLSVIEALTLGPEGLRPYGVDEDEIDALLDASLADVVVHLGVPDISGRGCELAFEDGAYGVREFTPATPADWQISLELVAGLSRHLESPIIGEDGRSWTAQTIISFDATADIDSGIQAMTRHPGDGTTMVGVVRPVSLTAAMAEEIHSAPSPAERFGDIFTAIQNDPAHDARQMLVEGPEGSVQGIYALTEGVRTVLPRTPHLAPGSFPELQAGDITWKLALVVDDEPGVMAEIDYAEALERLAARQVQVLDEASLVVPELSGEELRALVG